MPPRSSASLTRRPAANRQPPSTDTTAATAAEMSTTDVSTSTSSSSSPPLSSTSSAFTVASESLLNPTAHPLRISDASPLLPTVITEPLLPADTEDHGGPPSERYRPTKRWVFPFPSSLDTLWRPVDDLLIRLLQRPLNSPLRLPYLAFAILLTVFTAIEFGLVLPFSLYLMGYDSLGDLATFLLLTLSVISQIPKRFVWRPRPWMVERALKVRKDKTSSFPSRAVTCAVVYGALLGVALSPTAPFPLVILVAGVAALLASAARVIVGAHYPSDCLVGAVAGAAITSLGWGFYAAEVATCGACDPASDPSCYTAGVERLSSDHVALNWGVVLGTVVVSSLVLLGLQAPPLHFWTKSAHVLGVLTPCILFRLTWLCPPLNGGVALAPPSLHSAASIGLAVFLAAVCTLCAKVMDGLKGVFSWLGFLALSGLLYVVLAVCRSNGV